jgi:hypothetical protein
MKFTTSWDDGYTLDLRIADLLERFSLQGTFYVSPQVQLGQQMLSHQELLSLASRFEIGAHTLSHPRLSRLTQEEARREIAGSKKWIEEETGKPCTMFCYPKGDEAPWVRTLVREAGFQGARTVVPLQFSATDPFGLPTTLHVYPFPWRRKRWKWWHHLDPLGPLRVHWRRLGELGIPLTARRTWLSLAKALFLHAQKTQQPFFHLWGHSEEIGRFGLWDELAAFLEFVHNQPGIEHVPNSGLLPLPAQMRE